MRKAYFLSLLLFIAVKATSQSTAERIIEDNYIQQEDMNYEQLYETLVQYLNDPLDLSKATEEELNTLGILNPFQIQNLIEYRSISGGFISLLELQAINGFDMLTIQNLLPFVRLPIHIEKQPFLKRVFSNSGNYLITQTSLSNSLDSTMRYKGIKQPLLLRYRNYKSNDFSIGFTLKNDAGEPLQWNYKNQYYFFDYTSYHFALYNKGKIKAIIIGDYKLQFGQGLICGGGFNLGKGGETILSTKQNNSGILANTSSTASFRGTAVTLSLYKLSFTPFISYTKKDATVDTITDSFTLSNSSYHRNEKELSKRKTISEYNIGFNLTYTSNNRKLQLGWTNIYTGFSKTQSISQQIYNQFQFHGKSNAITGTNFNYLYKNFNFFGELAISESGGTGTVAGFITSLHKQIDASVHIRNFDRNFHSFYSNAFAESSTGINESGIYTGIKMRPLSKMELSAYFDKFSSPWIKYQTYGISRGYEYLTRLLYSPGKKVELSVQFKTESKETNDSEISSSIYQLTERLKRNYQISYRFQLTNIKIGSKVQYSTIHENNQITKGYAIVNDFEYMNRKLALAFRYAMFDTDNYDNRQYVYERNFIYNFSIASYYGKGSRCYFMLKYNLNSTVQLWLRFTQTAYEAREKEKERSLSGMLLISF